MDKKNQFNQELQELAGFAKLVSHPARLQILEFLAEQKSCLGGDISNHLPLAASTVSQHLKELKAGGLISGTVDGTKICYCINAQTMKTFSEIFNQKFGNIIQCCETECC